MGSTVKEMNSEISTAAEMVIPNCLKNCPTIPGMNATGTKTATSVKVVASTARPTSLVPIDAAVAGSSPRSSRWVIASRTTTASSMRRPIASERASSVIWFSVYPSRYMTKKVPITLVGSASEEMNVPRGSSRKSRMMTMAIAPPKKRAMYTSCALARISSL